MKRELTEHPQSDENGVCVKDKQFWNQDLRQDNSVDIIYLLVSVFLIII